MGPSKIFKSIDVEVKEILKEILEDGRIPFPPVNTLCNMKMKIRISKKQIQLKFQFP